MRRDGFFDPVSEGIFKSSVREPWHLVLGKDASSICSRSPFIRVEVACSQSILQANMPGKRSSPYGEALLQPEVHSAIGRSSRCIDL